MCYDFSCSCLTSTTRVPVLSKYFRFSALFLCLISFPVFSNIIDLLTGLSSALRSPRRNCDSWFYQKELLTHCDGYKIILGIVDVANTFSRKRISTRSWGKVLIPASTFRKSRCWPEVAINCERDRYWKGAIDTAWCTTRKDIQWQNELRAAVILRKVLQTCRMVTVCNGSHYLHWVLRISASKPSSSWTMVSPSVLSALALVQRINLCNTIVVNRSKVSGQLR